MKYPYYEQIFWSPGGSQGYDGNSSTSKKEIVHMKTTINPNDKKSNYFLNLQFEPFPFSKSRTISALPFTICDPDCISF